MPIPLSPSHFDRASTGFDRLSLTAPSFTSLRTGRLCKPKGAARCTGAVALIVSD